jgi:putative CocE/NonD family hydrolase
VRARLVLVAAALVAALVPLTGLRADPTGSPWKDTNGYIPVAQGTADATVLHYQVRFPDAATFGNGPYPTVVDYSGYEPAITFYDGLAGRFLAEGYAVAGVNIRGTGCSGGKFDYFEPLESKDGAEAIDWLGSQPWSNGKVAMVGKSYPGITQLFVAAQQPKHLAAIVPGNVFGDLYRDVPYPGGIANVAFAGGWSAGRVFDQAAFIPTHKAQQGDQQCMQNQADHAPNPALNPFVKAIQPQNQFDGDLYHQRSPWYFADKIDVPTLLVEAFQDEQVGSRAMELVERFHPGLTWRMAVTNGNHGEYYSNAIFPLVTRFLAYHLRGAVPAGDAYAGMAFPDALAKYDSEPRVRVEFENSKGTSRFHQEFATWPPPKQEVWRLGLTANGGLVDTAVAPTPAPAPAGSVNYAYAPGVGSQERGGYSLQGSIPNTGFWTDRPPNGTFASFTSAPLDSDHMLFGPASVDLMVSSTAADTDFEVTLSEVRPDGQEMFVQQGWLRASHRKEDPTLSTPLRPYQTHLATDVQPLVPGSPTPVRIEVFPFGHVFRAGSRLRLVVAAPHVKPDLWGFAALPVPAVNTIYTGGSGMSSLALPLVPADAVPAGLPPCTLDNQPCRPEPAS